MRRLFKPLFLVCIILITNLHLLGQDDIPSRPIPPRLVNDFAGFFSTDESNYLENKLVTFNNETSTQITIVTVTDLKGYDISEFAFRLGEEWGVGQEGFDNGIVILIKPKRGNGKGEIFIATGYGLEGVVPDAVAGRIVRAEILPSFSDGEYLMGIDNALSVLLDLTREEYTPDEYIEKSGDLTGSIGVGIFFLLIFFISIFARSRRARHYSPGHRIPFWTALFLASSTGRRHTGSFGNFSSGGGSFGGGGGGFGGFGGGSFGGGGAGGSW